MTEYTELRRLATAANRPMSEIGLMEHKRAAMRAMHGALLPDDVLALLADLERKDALLLRVKKCNEECGPVDLPYALACDIDKELGP